MMQEIYNQLGPARKRLSLVLAARYVAVGLVAGSLAAVVLAVAGSLFAVPMFAIMGWGAIVFGLVAGFVLALLNATTWRDAAGAVDRHFRLEDRTQSAIAFLEQGKSGGLYALQMNDTATRLADLDTRAAVSIKPPRALAIGIGWVAVAAALLVFLPMNETTHSSVLDATNDANPPKSTPATSSDSPAASADASWRSADNREVLSTSFEVFAQPVTGVENTTKADLVRQQIR